MLKNGKEIALKNIYIKNRRMQDTLFNQLWTRVIIVLVSLSTSIQVYSQEQHEGTDNPRSSKNQGTYKSYRDKAAYPFVVYDPQLPDSVKAPVILFLHGRSLSGTDLKKVFSYGVLDAIGRGKEIPAIVIAPQVSKSQFWEPDKVLTVLDFVQKNYATDLQKVYVVGMSLGGYGTLSFAGKYPNRMAAGVAMCGGGNANDACNIAATNMWILHGEKDKAVPVSESITIYEAITSCDQTGDCHLTLYPHFGHGELAREFYKDTLYNWLFQYQLSDSVSLTEPILETDQIEKINCGGPPAISPVDMLKQEKSKPKNEKKDLLPAVHFVKKGDTLYALSKKYNIPLNKLFEINGLDEKSILHLNQKIRLY